MDSNSERKWDHRTLLKEEVDASFISKKEASLKRERIKEYYSFNHRVSFYLLHIFVLGSFAHYKTCLISFSVF